ncbi:MAG TPA: UDP-N-acetylmuramyl-tripeptide synthetase [Candidatus Portnoybacteria bacterium]|nr:UDP-N-acetylmuramyl-tripeptide synthetase [Candidatus Portnoybacteria bacterium]
MISIKSLLKRIIPQPIFQLYHFCLAFLGALIYRFPSRKMVVIGITGTKGKTTTANLVAQILEVAGFKVGLATTVNFQIGQEKWLNTTKQTMLGRFRLQKILRQMANQHCQYAIVETSSEGILQYRHKFIDYDIGIFTNLTPEHIEHHGSFEKYRQAKMKLFQKIAQKKNGVGIFNLDSDQVNFFLQPKIKNRLGFGLKPHPEIDFPKFIPEKYSLSAEKTIFALNQKEFSTQLIGQFNLYNILASIALARSQNIDWPIIQKAVSHFISPPGRLEKITAKNKQGENFLVIIDYAHEPNSLENIYQTAHLFHPQKIIAVLGSQGGGRDKAKRPKLGKLADQYVDYIILTNEDPYNENPQQIINDITQGIKNKSIKKIIDRQEAIIQALNSAHQNDLVIITGKGGETSMCIGNQKIPWSDHKIVQEWIKNNSKIKTDKKLTADS